MLRRAFVLIALTVTVIASAQFVRPKPEYNVAEPGVYVEDPFIIEYRERFFAVFRGDIATFDAAMAEIEQMVEEDPTDARALVWRGNGRTVRAGILALTGDREAADALLAESNADLDAAVALSPDDPNIYMMRAATLYVQHQYLPQGMTTRATYERLRDDCLKFIEYIGPERMPKVSIHVRGETYGELGVAYAQLGETDKAIAAFERLIEIVPGTAYEDRARREIEALRNPSATDPAGAK